MSTKDIPYYRPRRLRRTTSIRSLIQECRLSLKDLVMPLFIIEGENQRSPIAAMPGIDRLSPDLILQESKELWQLGIQAVALFPVVDARRKDSQAREAYNQNGFYQKTITMVKQDLPEMTVITDVALDPYNSDGHDGLVEPRTGEVLNDASLEPLASMALCQARAGTDMIAPSDMMDGRVAYIRTVLDQEGFSHVGVISYTAKYASAFYGPFRAALQSAPHSGDKKSYQMDPANAREAIREAHLDITEGADILLVKPGLAYLDVLYQLRQHSLLPLAVYNVSGEYAMLRTAAQAGSLEYKNCVLEVLTSFKRAGADLIFSYHAKEVGQWL